MSPANTISVHPIHTKAEYRSAMARINVLAEQDPPAGTREFDELEIWSLIVRHYEDEHFPQELPSIKDVVEFRADQMGLSTIDLDAIFGGSGRRSEVLSGKRALSKSMASRLRTIGVPDPVLLELLLQEETEDTYAIPSVVRDQPRLHERYTAHIKAKRQAKKPAKRSKARSAGKK
jgi:HTH-type transcriptional regulator/antitoxin HigA